MSPGVRVPPHLRLHRGIRIGGYGYGSPEAAVVVAQAVGMWVSAEWLSKHCVSRAPYPRPNRRPRSRSGLCICSLECHGFRRRMLPHLLGRRRRAAAAALTASRPVPWHRSISRQAVDADGHRVVLIAIVEISDEREPHRWSMN